MHKLVASMLAVGAFTALAAQSQAVVCDTFGPAAWPAGVDAQDLSCSDGTRGRGVADNSGPLVFASVFDAPTGQAETRVVGLDDGDPVCEARANEVVQDVENDCDRQPTTWLASLANN
jgi:hypothetical protein